MRGFKIALNVIISLLALQAVFVAVNVILTGIFHSGGMGVVGRLDAKELMYPIFFLGGIFYYKKTNEKPMIIVSSIGLISKVILYVFTLSQFKG